MIALIRYCHCRKSSPVMWHNPPPSPTTESLTLVQSLKSVKKVRQPERHPLSLSNFFDSDNGCFNSVVTVSPAYGYIGSALVKCSNDGGPGPRYNRKEDPGSSIFSMLVVYFLHLLTSSKNQVTGRISGDPLPPFKPTWSEPPPPPPWGTYPAPCKK